MELEQEQEQKSFAQKLQEKLAQSRFFTFSLLLHVELVVLGGSVVLFHRMTDAPDFTSDGGGLMSNEVTAQPPQEQPPDMSQQTVTPEAPSINAPSVSAITSTTSNAASFQMASIPMPVKAIAGDMKNLTDTSKAMSHNTGHGVPSAMGGRMGGVARGAMMQKNNGKEKSEKAVLAGLRWLKDHQAADGSWSDEFKPAMTGLALLSFLGHGELPESPEFGPTVKKALDWVLERGNEFQGRMSMTKDGWGGNDGVYQHGIVTYAMGEYYSMTKDERYAPLLKQAVAYIVDGQNPLGGWDYGYAKGARNDLSVAGWQIQALKAAHLTGLGMPGVDEALDKSMGFIQKWQGNEGGFGYDHPDNGPNLTGVGVLCTYFWKQDKTKVVKEGIDFMLGKTKVEYRGKDANLYAWYYDTQACLMFGGSAWSKWNRMFQDEIADNISPDGSWPPLQGGVAGLQSNPNGSGPYYRTTLCILMLEVFYRYMPINK